LLHGSRVVHGDPGRYVGNLVQGNVPAATAVGLETRAFDVAAGTGCLFWSFEALYEGFSQVPQYRGRKPPVRAVCEEVTYGHTRADVTRARAQLGNPATDTALEGLEAPSEWDLARASEQKTLKTT
jgi:hypothetical protein